MSMRKGNQYETTVMGKEPLWTDINTLSETEIGCRAAKAINWYNYFCSDEDYKEFVLDYCKQIKDISKETLNQIRSLNKNNYLFRRLGSICRIKTLGGKVGSTDESYFNDHLSDLIASCKGIVVIEDSPKVVRSSVQDHIKDKICSTIGELEGKIDEFLNASDYRQFMKSFKIETWIINNKLKAYECQAIHDYYSEIIKEKQEALEGNDPQLKEGYEYLGKVKLKKFVELLNNIIDITGQFATKKKQRKPRKKKAKSPEKLIKNLKYLKQDTGLGLTSIDPRDIIGASKVVVYNTKYSKVCLYETESLEGFSIKGTTLQNVNKSVCKVVRKPKEFFKGLGNGIRSFTNHYDGLKTKETEATPRLNEHTIIVKAFK